MYNETKWDVPAIVVGQPQARDWEHLYGGGRRPPPRMLTVDNHRGTTTITLRRGIHTRRVKGGVILDVTEHEMGGSFEYYELDADDNTVAGAIHVYESYEEVE